MSDLSFLEKRKLENLLKMDGGYVLNFTDFTFQQFMVDSARVDIDHNKYFKNGRSKAKRLRAFWEIEPNQVVAKSIAAMIELIESTANSTNLELRDECRKIADRLFDSSPVPEISAIEAISDDRVFDALAVSVREAVENGKPEEGLDRLHTFLVKYVRFLCEKAGVDTNPKKALHAIFGEYVKCLRAEQLIESDMAERILRATTSIFESFNHVRNQQSLAHDNSLLGYHESLFIINHVCAAVRFLRAVDDLPSQIEAAQAAKAIAPSPDDIPF